MVFKMKFTEDPELYPNSIYCVDKVPSFVVETAKKFGLSVDEPEPNNNVMLLKPVQGTIYLFMDFEDHRLFPPVERTPNTWILGPTALIEMADNPDLEMRTKPTYCTFMYGYVFYINCPEDIHLMKRMVRLLKWMGGRFVLEPNFSTTHMITTSTQAKGYNYCYTFNVPILSPAWVEYCWEMRHIPNFKVTSVMDTFKLKAFSDLYIAIKGFSPEELVSLQFGARSNGAVIVTPDDPQCTHLVFQRDVARHVNINDIPTHISYVVNEDWLRCSIDQNQRTYEDGHLCFSQKEIKKSLYAIMAAEEVSEKIKRKSSTFKASLNNGDKALLEAAKKDFQDVKRKYAFEDLHLKEKNYLCCLKQLVNIQNLATQNFQSGGAILNYANAKLIFGNLHELVGIHQELTNYFEAILMDWKNEAITVQRIIDLKDLLLKEYVTYTNNYKGSKEYFEKYETENKRFRKLIENSMKTASKEHPKDLFIRPIQRLCSVVLQLHEINKNTREGNPDKPVLNEAIRVVSDVLQRVNNSQEEVDKLTCIFDIHRRIKDCPPDLIISHREFITQFSAQEAIDEQLGMHMMFFLFNDILEVTKVRMKKGEAILKSQISREEKPFKHLVSLPLSMIVNVIEFEGKYDCDKSTFGFNVRDTTEEGTTFIYCFQYSDENRQKLSDVLMLIAKQLALGDSSKTPKDFILSSVPISRVRIATIPPKPERKGFKKMYDLFKKPNNSNKTTQEDENLRKSLSCGNLLDPSIML